MRLTNDCLPLSVRELAAKRLNGRGRQSDAGVRAPIETNGFVSQGGLNDVTGLANCPIVLRAGSPESADGIAGVGGDAFPWKVAEYGVGVLRK